MLHIQTFCVNPLQENCYVASDDTREAVIIDCGAYDDHERQAIENYLNDHQLKPMHLLCTHGHFDHVFGNDSIYATYHLKPMVHGDDADFMTDVARQCSELGMGDFYNRPTPPFTPGLTDGSLIRFGTHQLEVIHTPGHTPGSVIFLCREEHVAFTGDTLFRMSIGRTDLPRGSWQQMAKSLAEKVAKLPEDTVIYPGHGPRSIMKDEIAMNPYLSNI